MTYATIYGYVDRFEYRLDDELRFLCDLDHRGNGLINRGRSPRLINVSKVI